MHFLICYPGHSLNFADNIFQTKVTCTVISLWLFPPCVFHFFFWTAMMKDSISSDSHSTVKFALQCFMQIATNFTTDSSILNILWQITQPCYIILYHQPITLKDFFFLTSVKIILYFLFYIVSCNISVLVKVLSMHLYIFSDSCLVKIFYVCGWSISVCFFYFFVALWIRVVIHLVIQSGMIPLW